VFKVWLWQYFDTMMALSEQNLAPIPGILK